MNATPLFLFFLWMFWLYPCLYAQETEFVTYREILEGKATPPHGWLFQRRVEFSPQQLSAIEQKLGRKLIRVINTFFRYKNYELQINLVDCKTTEDAEVLYKRFLSLYQGNQAFVLLNQNSVIEFARTPFKVVVQAHYDFGFKPSQVTYKVSFFAAPLEHCNYMQWNPLFNLFLAWNQGQTGEKTLQNIQSITSQFQFGNTLSFKKFGQGKTPSLYTFDPHPEKEEVRDSLEQIFYTFKEMPLKAGVPNIHVSATIVSEAFTITPSERQAEAVLLSATPFWPSTDSEVLQLAQEITKNATTVSQKVEAILEWLAPGKNIRYAGEQKGSRYGVKQVLTQKFGHCWDFSDCFVTLCRASGIPTRQVLGWWYGYSGHVWAEVLLEGEGWWAVDPTANMACTSEYIPYLATEDGHISLVYTAMVEIQR